MIFYKCHANQNDFIFIENNQRLEFSQVAKKLCNRRSSIGSDGLVVFGKKEPYYFRFYNPDGSESRMCGNALIAYPALLAHCGIELHNKIRITTKIGIREITISSPEKNSVTSILDMGKPLFNPYDISKHLTKSSMNDYQLRIEDKTFICNFVSFGNPHCVIFVNEMIDIEKYGPLIEKNKLFSEGINVEFVRIRSKNELIVDFWERGAGHTYSCGSGSCAAFAIAYKKNLCNDRVAINKNRNSITVFSKNSHIMFQSTGYFVFEGVI